MRPKAYYNEFDYEAAAWLRELIKSGLIMDGEVDERDIKDVEPKDLAGFTQCHFFAGIGGWSLALQYAGWNTRRPVWTGSCPCQPLSCAGKRKGHEDKRHLWPEFHRLIRECKPVTVFGEQVASKLGIEWIDGISLDLEAINYAVGSCDLPASCVGAPHIRQRLWWVAQSATGGLQGVCQSGKRVSEPDEPSASSGLADSALQGDGRRYCGSTEGNQSVYEPGTEQRFSGCSPCGGLGDSESWENNGRKSGNLAEAERQWRCGNHAVDASGSNGRMADSGQPGLEGHAGDGSDRNESGRIGAESVGYVAASRESCWQSIAIPCRDGKIRRIPNPEIKPFIFSLLSDGISVILGNGWTENCIKTEKEITGYAEKAQKRPGEILFEMWNIVAEKAIQRQDGGYESFSSTEILLIALCKLQGDKKQKIGTTTYDIAKIEENTLRILWQNSDPFTTFTRSPYQRELDGSQTGKYSDIVCGMSFGITQAKKKKMQDLRGTGEGSWNVFEALSTVEKIWRSSFDEKNRRVELHYIQGWIQGLTGFPLSGKVKNSKIMLKGAGNAIVPQVAAQFIRAYMEVLGL
jgi:DNA (cytosine-5)-methyltransferase 1